MRLTRKSFFLNFFWSSTAFFAGIIRGIFLIPLFLRFWSEELYGFWIVLTSFNAYLVYIFDGYSNFSANEYNLKYYKNKQEAYKYFGSGFKSFILIAVVSVVLLILGLYILPVFSVTTSTPQEARHFEACMIIIAVTGFIHCLAKYLSTAITPSGKIYVAQRFFAIYLLAETFLWVVLAFTMDDMLNIILCFCSVLILFSLSFMYIIIRKYPFYKTIFSSGNFIEGFLSFKRSLHFVLNNFFERFTGEGLVLFVSTIFRGTYLPQTFASTRTMGNLMLTGGNTVYSTFMIEYQRQTAKGNGSEIANLFNGTWLIVGILLNFTLIIFYPLLDGLYLLWTQYKFPFEPGFFYYILSATVLSVYGFNILLYLKSLNLIRQLYVVSCIKAAILVVWLIIVPRSLINIGLGLLVTESFVNIIVLNLLLHTRLVKLECENVWRKIFWSAMPYIFTAIFVMLGYKIDIDNSLKMIIALTLLSVIYYIQIGKTGNETLVVRFQLIKHKILTKFKH